MALPAFRDGDPHACTQHGVDAFRSVLHVPIETNGDTQRRCGDRCICGGAPTQVIERGAATVLVAGEYAARILAPTRHGGMLLVGSPNVVIGGPDGAGLRRPPHARCNAMAAGRKSGSRKQSYNNCGIESSRYLIEQKTGKRLQEDQLLYETLAHADANVTDKDGGPPGGTTPSSQVRILARHGIEAGEKPQTVDGIASDVQAGRGVIAGVWGDRLWGGPQQAQKGGHAVVVTGVEYDEQGKPAVFVLQDSGSGSCSRRVPADQFEQMLIRENPAVVTKEPVW
jgi:uncharacterized Zn-binding protein involved in type VI secretion